MIMMGRRYFLVPTRVISACSLLLSLLLLLALALVRVTAIRLWLCAGTVPTFLWTTTLLRWRIGGNFREALTWSFIAGVSGLVAWILIR
jgi:hypothetical protein